MELFEGLWGAFPDDLSIYKLNQHSAASGHWIPEIVKT